MSTHPRRSDSDAMQDEQIPKEPASLAPELQQAEVVLRDSIGEVCSADVRNADTGEMIRLDEMLAIASEAAKKAVSIRRRLRSEKKSGTPRAPRRRATPDTAAKSGEAPAGSLAAEASAASGSEHRTFRDRKGVTWSVWAVHPRTVNDPRRPALPGTFTTGWLAFVCEQEKRRLSPVPEGWERLDDLALERLCGRAEPARTEASTVAMPPLRSRDGDAASP